MTPGDDAPAFEPAALAEESPLHRAAQQESDARMQVLLGRVPAPFREVLVLRFQEEMKPEEIASITSTPSSSRTYRSKLASFPGQGTPALPWGQRSRLDYVRRRQEGFPLNISLPRPGPAHNFAHSFSMIKMPGKTRRCRDPYSAENPLVRIREDRSASWAWNVVTVYGRSTASATALPPPRHSAAMPRLRLRRCNS